MNVAVRQMEALLSKKWDREYLIVCGYVQACLSIILSRLFSHLLRKEREQKGGGGRRSQGYTSRVQNGDAADRPRVGRLED